MATSTASSQSTDHSVILQISGVSRRGPRLTLQSSSSVLQLCIRDLSGRLEERLMLTVLSLMISSLLPSAFLWCLSALAKWVVIVARVRPRPGSRLQALGVTLPRRGRHRVSSCSGGRPGASLHQPGRGNARPFICMRRRRIRNGELCIHDGYHYINCAPPPRVSWLRPWPRLGGRDLGPWNNGNRHPRWGVAEIQKMTPPKL